MAIRRSFFPTHQNVALEQAGSFLVHASVLYHWRALVLAFVFLAGFGVRMLYVSDPPLEFHSTRQYRSMIIARGYYFDSSISIPEWKKQIARASQQKQGILEPPIMEFLASAGYGILGGEYFWFPRLLSSLFWLVGGGFLYLIGRKIADPDAALFATAFYLFLPFAVVASRSFQPDPLMIMLLLGCVLAVFRYYEAPSKSRLAVAAAISSLAFLVKPHSVFVILGAFTALGIYQRGFRRGLINETWLVFVTITLLPTITIYAYNVARGGFFLHEAEKTLLPQLWISPFFWRSWINNVGFTVGFIPFIGALLGTFFFREGLPRALMIGLWSGYVLFGLVLNYNFATHDYYQLQLIPIVGLSIGPIMALVTTRLNTINPQLQWRMGAWSILLLGVIVSMGVARARLVNPDAERKIRTEQEIGQLVNHSTNAIFLSGDYGVPLEYHGLISGSSWPLASDFEWERLAGVPVLDAEERFNSWFAKKSPEYFIVEDLREFDQQSDLQRFLSRFPIVSHSNEYLIFKLKGSKDR